MKIEKIEKSKHQQERILVTLEGGDLLRVTQSELLHFGLYVGLDISGETVVELKESGKKSEVRVQAVNMVSSRPLSRKELTRRLAKKGASDADAASAADYLASLGALDDASYAAMLVRHYSAAGYGPARLREELQHRGVPRELWEDALALAPPEEEAVCRVLAAKCRGGAADERGKKRLADMLLRRGFSYGAVRSAIRSIAAEDGGSDD